MRVIGIDPAPAKGLYTFDGLRGDLHVPLNESRGFIDACGCEFDVLVCWDSPLTGPPEIVVNGGEGIKSAFSQRPIESFFSRVDTGFRTPPGISVRPYSGCSHWAMSRSLIGLPKVGPFDLQAQIPFELVVTNVHPNRGHNVVEVHPALAAWLWCRNGRLSDANWEYKRRPGVLKELWSILIGLREVAETLPRAERNVPDNDDVFDARVSWLLGRLWLDGASGVGLLGNADVGTFLLPDVEKVVEPFQKFLGGVAMLNHAQGRRVEAKVGRAAL